MLLFAVTIMLVFCGDWFGCGLLLLLRSRLLRFGVLLLLLVVVSLLMAVVDVDFAATASNGFAVGIILLKLEKSNRYRIVHLSLSCACEKFMPAKWKPPMPPVQPINSRNTSFTLKLNLEWNEIRENAELADFFHREKCEFPRICSSIYRTKVIIQRYHLASSSYHECAHSFAIKNGMDILIRKQKSDIFSSNYMKICVFSSDPIWNKRNSNSSTYFEEHSTYPHRQCFRTNVEISFSSCQ